MSISTVKVVKAGTPLVVDLDGTLTKSDVLIEAIFTLIKNDPLSVFRLIPALLRGKAFFKDLVARSVEIDPATLPYDQAVLGYIHEAIAEGRPVYLASASNERYVSAVADDFGFFSGWFGSTATTNNSGLVKARLLTETFGEGAFDYIGNDREDLHVWRMASRRIGVRTPSHINKQLLSLGVEAAESPRPTLKTWLKLLRVHQYAKNALVFLALFTAHKFDVSSFYYSALAAAAFSFCASSAYILNDLLDLSADRGHPTKKNRPLAAGTIPISQGVVAIPLLFFAAMALAACVSLPFVGIVLFYFAVTNAYSFWLKSKMLIDVVALAMLYTLRVIGGAIAINVFVSEWLLAFSLFIFASLALIKRYVELATRSDRELPDPTNRNYKLADMQIVAALAAAAGFNAVTVLTFYISSDAVRTLYRRPQFLWLLCPILMYWLSRMLMMAHRRMLHDDPVVFALTDRVSILAGACIIAITLAAM